MAKRFNIHDWQAKQRLTEQEDEWQKRQDALTPGKNPDAFYGDDSVFNKDKGWVSSTTLDNPPKVLDRIISWAEHTFAEVLPDGKLSPLAIDELQKIIDGLEEIEVTGMEPDTGNMEKEFNVIGPKNQSNPLDDVEIEYREQTYILDFEFGDVIDDHGNEGRDEWWEAEAEDGTTFMVDVYTTHHRESGMDPEEIYWDTLQIETSEDKEDWAHAMDQAKADREDQIPMGEQNSLGAAGSGASFQPGKSMAHMPKKAWRRRNKKMKEAIKAKVGKYELGISGGLADKVNVCITGNCE